MCLKTLFTVSFIILSQNVEGVPLKQSLVQVPFGDSVTLECESNDNDHSFLYWYVSDKDIIIGPTNKYDLGKFRYEVLSGNLTVKSVSKEEEGVYNCVSRGVRKDDFNIRSVRMVVEADWEEVYEEDPSVNLFRVVVVIGSLMIISGLGYAGYRMWKTRYRHPTYLIPLDEEEEDSGEELFSAPGASRSATQSILKSNSTDSFETPGISTDFRSILDTANNK